MTSTLAAHFTHQPCLVGLIDPSLPARHGGVHRDRATELKGPRNALTGIGSRAGIKIFGIVDVTKVSALVQGFQPCGLMMLLRFVF